MARRFGQNRFLDDEDEDPGSFGARSPTEKKNPFDDDADDNLLRMRTQITQHEDRCLESTKVSSMICRFCALITS